MNLPRLVIAGLSGGSGKTLLSLGLSRALSWRGLNVKTFKKGPDYLDAAWLALASGTPQGNLDPYFCLPQTIRRLFAEACRDYDLVLIEGNRGLFDGVDSQGTYSTAALARMLNAPVLLIMDCSKMTHTAAALILGCKQFEPKLHLGGVILNRLGTERQRRIIVESIEQTSAIPVMGSLFRNPSCTLQERGLGLCSPKGRKNAEQFIDRLAEQIRASVDLDAVLGLAASAQPWRVLGEGLSALRADNHAELCSARSPSGEKSPDISASSESSRTKQYPRPKCSPLARIGYIHDAVLNAVYKENIDSLAHCKTQPIALSILKKNTWQDLDALYLPGGQPEHFAAKLAALPFIREQLRLAADAGLPIYAEGGGFICLCQKLTAADREFELAGIFPVHATLSQKPRGLGYVLASAAKSGPFFPKCLNFPAHEFHFYDCQCHQPDPEQFLLKLAKGNGLLQSQAGNYDGLCSNQVFGSLCQIYAPAVPEWAVNLARAAQNYREQR